MTEVWRSVISGLLLGVIVAGLELWRRVALHQQTLHGETGGNGLNGDVKMLKDSRVQDRHDMRGEYTKADAELKLDLYDMEDRIRALELRSKP